MFVIKFTNLIVAFVLVIPNIAVKYYRSTSRLLGEEYSAKFDHKQLDYYDEPSEDGSNDLAREKVKEWHNKWTEYDIQKNKSRVRRRVSGEKSTLFYAITMPNHQDATTIDRLEIFKFTEAVSDDEAVRSIETGEGKSQIFEADLTKSKYDYETRKWVWDNVKKLEDKILGQAAGYWKKESKPGKVMYIYKSSR